MKSKLLTKKRVTFWAILVLSLVFLSRIASPEEGENFEPRLSIKLSSGLSYMLGGDINAHLRSYDNYLSEMTNYEGDKIRRLHYTPELEGELRWDITSKFAVSVGIGYISGKNKSYLKYTGPFPFQTSWNPTQSYFLKSKAKTVPLKLGIYYTLSLSPRINLFLNSGLGYYFSKGSLYKKHTSASWWGYTVYYTKEEQYDVRANSLGFNGGIGFEYDIANNLVIVLEVQGRYARTKNLKGNKLFSVWEFSYMEEEGILYIGERDMTDEGYGKYCPDLIISQSKPSGDEFRNIREAVLDFSGYSLRLGIRIKLF
jgi:hypothetical protein